MHGRIDAIPDYVQLFLPVMLDSHHRTLFLTGAPTASSLSWTEADLSAILQPCYLTSGNHSDGLRPTPDDVAPLWRFLPFEQAHLPTGLTQASREDGPYAPNSNPFSEASFFSTSDMSFVSTEFEGDEDRDYSAENEEVLSQFYEHSLFVHDDVPSSQIISAGSMVEVSFSTDTDEESSTNGVINSQEQRVRSRLASGFLGEIKDVPNAAHLRSITPQTMTVDLVVGIISISQPRPIRTRKGGRVVDLVEMLVGDETRAGFCINIWIPCTPESRDASEGRENLRFSTSQLRPQDIVLVKTVALSSFRGKVHGQSLRKGLTTVDLLYRNTIDREDTRGVFQNKDLEQEALIDSHVLKVKKVKDWVMQFVGTNARPPALANRRLPRESTVALQALPSDTP